jgi:hypothetical protein
MPPQTAAARRSVAPRHPRRISGPARRLRVAPAPAHTTRGRTAAFERIRALPDHRIVDGLLRSRAWIVVVGVLLGGIVAMQVSLLKLNSGISRAVEASATLERQNADMQDQIARLESSQRVGDAAAAEGMVFPPAGDVGYLRARGERDDQLAARRLTPPSAEAQAVMDSGGHAPAATVPAATPTPVPQG